MYAKAISVAFARSHFLRELGLTPSEKVYLPIICILTIWILPARVYYPTRDVIGQLRSIFKMAWGHDSWGLSLSQYGHHTREGGFSMIIPCNFLLFPHGTLFLHSLSKLHHFAVQIAQECELWCEAVGLTLSLTHLPTLQIAVLQWSLLNVICPSCKAYSRLRSCLPMALNEHVTEGDILVIHDTMFTNEHGQTHFSKKLVAEGSTTIAALDKEP